MDSSYNWEKSSLIKFPKETIHRTEFVNNNSGLAILTSNEYKNSKFVFFDLQSQKKQERTLKNLIQNFQPYDLYGNLYTCFDYQNGYLYDKREGKLNKFFNLEKHERYFNLVYSTFNQERVISFVLSEKIASYDIRNMGECIHKMNHYCKAPPIQTIKILKEKDETIKNLSYKNCNFEYFKKQFENSASSFSKDKQPKGWFGIGLFSPRASGNFLYLDEYRIRDKAKLKNTFYYEILKELNLTIDRDCLFHGLFQTARRPVRLFSSNMRSPELRIKGAALLEKEKFLYCFNLDKNDGVSLQLLKRIRDNISKPSRIEYAEIAWDQNLEKNLKINANNFLKKSEQRKEFLAKENENSDEESSRMITDDENNFLEDPIKKNPILKKKSKKSDSDESFEESDSDVELNNKIDYKTFKDVRNFVEERLKLSKEKSDPKTQIFDSKQQRLELGAIEKPVDEIAADLIDLANPEFYLSANITKRLKEGWT